MSHPTPEGPHPERLLPELKDEHRATDYVERPRLFDRPQNVRRLLTVFGLTCVVLFFADTLYHRHGSFEHSETSFGPEAWVGFYGIYGFVACVLLVLLATQLRRVLMRDEDYYERPALSQGPEAPQDPEGDDAR